MCNTLSMSSTVNYKANMSDKIVLGEIHSKVVLKYFSVLIVGCFPSIGYSYREFKSTISRFIVSTQDSGSQYGRVVKPVKTVSAGPIYDLPSIV